MLLKIVNFESPGVWMVGTIGHEDGSYMGTVLGSYSSLLLTPWLGIGALQWSSVLGMVAFNVWDKRWRRKPRQRKSLCR